MDKELLFDALVAPPVPVPSIDDVPGAGGSCVLQFAPAFEPDSESEGQDGAMPELQITDSVLAGHGEPTPARRRSSVDEGTRRAKEAPSCEACGARGHRSRSCPQTYSKRVRPPDASRRPNAAEPPALLPRGGSGGGAEDGPAQEDAMMLVCTACGSSRHVQAQCPLRLQNVECHKCHQQGHIRLQCPQTRCYNCGTYGHSSQVCHSKPHCFHCSHSGHRSSACPMKYKGRVCYQCNEPGHEAAHCPHGQLCRLCHQPGHLVAHCPAVTCHFCHEKGHTAGACAKAHCELCGGPHEAAHCRQPNTLCPPPPPLPAAANHHTANTATGNDKTTPPLSQPAVPSSVSSSPPQLIAAAEEGVNKGHAVKPAHDAVDGLSAAACTTISSSSVAVALAAPSSASEAAPAPLLPSSASAVVCACEAARERTSPGRSAEAAPRPPRRGGRVAVVIDGAYFERCLRLAAQAPSVEKYKETARVLQRTLDYLGDLFDRDPIAYWFDTDPVAFVDFVRGQGTAFAAAADAAVRECALKRQFLTDEMSLGRSLPNVVARLVGRMQPRRGYTACGAEEAVWVSSGIGAAVASCVIELFQDTRQELQVVLLSGDAGAYPAVLYCNTLRRNVPGYAACPPLRVCGTASTISPLYGQHQDLSDFLSQILLNTPVHVENGRQFSFPDAGAFV